MVKKAPKMSRMYCGREQVTLYDIDIKVQMNEEVVQEVIDSQDGLDISDGDIEEV
jgi:hypothetical protein